MARAVGRLEGNVKAINIQLHDLKAATADQTAKLDVLVARENRRRGERSVLMIAGTVAGAVGGWLVTAWASLKS